MVENDDRGDLMNCIKGIFKFFFILISITTVAGAGVAVLAFVFKRILKIRTKLKR